MSSTTSHAMFWCILSAALFGISPALSKWLLGSFEPILLASIMYLGAGLSTLPYSTKPQIHSRKEWLNIGGAILFGGILGPILLMYGIQKTGAATASLLLNFESVATVVLGWYFFKEHVSREILFSALLITIAGILLSLQESTTFTWGAIWICLACVCWGIDNHCTAIIEDLTPTQSTCIKGLSAGIFNFCLAIYLYGFDAILLHTNMFLGALAIGALSYGASIVLYIAGAQQLGATRAQLIFASAPYFGLICAYVFLSENVHIIHMVATGIMLIALWLQNKDNHQHKHLHHSSTHSHWHRHDDLHHIHTHKNHTKSLFGWHLHTHKHAEMIHSHEHKSDIHHRHH